MFKTDLAPVSLLEFRATSAAADRLIRNKKQLEHVKQLWIFLACVLAFFTCVRALGFVISCVWKPSPSNPIPDNEKKDLEHGHTTRANTFSLRHLPLAVTTAFRIVAFRSSVPIGFNAIASISEVAFILIYIAIMLVWLLVDTRDLNAMFYQDRAAHLASSQLPLIVALAGKNNIISWLTGISHEKLNVLHRAAARTNLLLLWLHAITRTVSGLPQQFDFTHDWMRSGAVGLTAFSIATLLSVRPIRNMAFEFFLISHIVLILIFLVGGYFHAKEQDYGAYIWPALLVWAFDRSLRGVRLLWNNRVWARKDSGFSTATVELLSEDTIRLSLRRKITWTPGQHAYVILPTISTLPVEAHPFSIASIPELVGASDDNNVVFLIRGKGGFTQRLRDHATRNAISTVPALLDGPYGCPPDLRPFSTCILIAGGSGISYTLPLLLNLIRENVNGGNSAVRRIVFVWAVRDGGHLKWISKALTEALSTPTSSLTVEPRVYITGSNYPIAQMPVLSNRQSESSLASDAEKGKVTPDAELPLYSSLKLIHGRPSIRKLLHDEISNSSGPVSVDVAGPTKLTESIRQALRSDVATPRAVLNGLPSVTLHVETFGMSNS
ncbi:FAD-binding domain-containing protein [Crucibulum laeve]|uniref:ferric-chelate reductase (NADPH) n=1 Tax=Crucibulum laeve TaxID=68775 RepID=A0A5C3MHH5_9AGAR|nr:FAD-binding domain-containing protein [Crucibulum laeve]